MAQEFRCGTPPPTESQRAEIMRKLRLNDGNRNACTDPINNSNKTYKLILEYAVKNGVHSLSPSYKTFLEGYLNTIYSNVNINFVISYFPVICDDCDDHRSPGWGRDTPIDNTKDFNDCLWGRLTLSGSIDDTGGLGDIFSGKFVSPIFSPTIAHELGHALGLYHTFDGFDPRKNSELVVQDGISCPCNCKTTADFICDTRANPYISPFDTETENAFPNWNSEMFSTTVIINSGDKSDHCGTSYSLLPPQSNLMSYQRFNHNNIVLENGQGSFIKAWNAGKPWETSGNTPPNAGTSMDPGFVVNSPMIITSPLNLTGDIIINSNLTIKNTVIGFMKGKGIIINTGGSLTVDNSHLIPYAGSGCFPEAQNWKGIEVINASSVKIMLKNNSTIERAINGIKGANCNFQANVLTGSKINCYNYKAIDLLNNTGAFQVGYATVNGKISIDNSYNGIKLISSTVNGSMAKIKNATFSVIGSNINAPVEVDNQGTQTMRLSSSTFFKYVQINALNGKGVVRDNTFKTEINSFFNASNIDLYNNDFDGASGPAILGFIPVTSLIFKNRLNNSNNGIQNANFYSNTRVECNNFLLPGTNDLFLREPIALSQGNPSLAAGNSFSRTPNLEVNYLGDQEIKYHYHPQGTEEPIRINAGAKFSKFAVNRNLIPSACSLPYPNTPPYPEHCYNSIKDGDETGVDCGGSCPKCPFSPDPNITISPEPIECTNGVQDQGETGIDCGGPCHPCFSTCTNGIQDSGEYGIDCGGICPLCEDHIPASCTDGIMNGNETGVDCGGPSCAPCITLYCHNGIQDHGETDIDCGGPCLPCNVPQCANGIQDGDETGIDCGGSCTPCHVVYPPHCYNGLQDANETGLDCGGSCPACVTVYPPHCYNGKRDGNETDTDCGGSCPPCTYTSGGGTNVGVNTGGNIEYYIKGSHTAFIQRLNEIYGHSYFTDDKYKVVQDFTAHRATLDGGNSCAIQQYIINNSATQPNRVIYELTALCPNVSANTIHILFGHSQYYTSAQIADILMLNPAVLTDRYISYILYKTATFSPAEKSQIVQSAISVSNRTDTETMLSFKKQYQDAIIRDNIAMLSLNTPFDFNGIRAEIATDPDPHKVFDIAQSYADQGRQDLALEALTQADICEITDPIYRSQLDGLITLYSNWSNVQANHEGSRNSIVQQLLSLEHGLATDLAADITNQPVKLKERWKYEPLTFLMPTSTKDTPLRSVDIYPNPAYDVLNIHVKGKNTGNDLVATIINVDGKVMSEFPILKDANNIDISALNTGVYTIKVIEQNHIVFTTKFIKIK